MATLAPISLSEPATRVASLTPSRNVSRNASAPTSPRKPGKTNAVPRSPMRALRKHTYGASFGNAARPSTASTATLCSVHSYADVPSSLRNTHASFSMAKGERMTAPATHGPTGPVRGAIPSSFKTTHSSFAMAKGERMTAAASCGPAVGSYAAPASTLKKSSSAVFSSSKLERLTAAPTHGPSVHSYAPLYSSFGPSANAHGAGAFRQGGVSFGSTAARGALPAVSSSTGLVSAPSTRPSTPLAATPLAPLSRPPTATGAGGGSTRVRSRLQAALQQSAGTGGSPPPKLLAAARGMARSATTASLVPASKPRAARVVDEEDKENASGARPAVEVAAVEAN